jgi:hypothetical protein
VSFTSHPDGNRRHAAAFPGEIRDHLVLFAPLQEVEGEHEQRRAAGRTYEHCHIAWLRSARVDWLSRVPLSTYLNLARY